MSNKPIAWMSPDGKVSQTEGKLFYIPLYTAPKPLSDAEIHEVWKSVTKNKFRGCHIDLVRAIEVKHGIRDIFRWHWEE